MKFWQLIEYNMRNILLEKSYTQFAGKTIPRPFSKKSKLRISLYELPKFLCSLFFIVCQVEGYQNILELSCRSFAFITYKSF